MTAVDGELVSVIVPAYNAAATLSETLEVCAGADLSGS